MACSAPYPCGEAKRAWPELVGWNVEAATEVIKRENPTVIRVDPIVQGKMVHLLDFCCDRVRAWVSDSNVIVRVPMVG